MPKLIPKMFRSSTGERRRSSVSSKPHIAPYKLRSSLGGRGDKNSGGIFRRRSVSMGGCTPGSSRKQQTKNNKKQGGNQSRDMMTIQPAITFTLSEDEANNNNNSSSSNKTKNVDGFADVENQLHIATNKTAEDDEAAVAMETDNNDKSPQSIRTMTFTHLELMRHELAHQMQLAARDREIHALQQQKEEMEQEHGKVLSTKDDEISKLKHALSEVETVLSKHQQELEVANSEQSKIIGVLMNTQVQLHEEQNKSWISPWLSFFTDSIGGN
mmetsp:Transcript_57422/g.140147  ORF Transcript_57422/g.140147 Transcript_57422/m.140147 type:complete len:271 (-) Transcript_57422:208-1020(-)